MKKILTVLTVLLALALLFAGCQFPTFGTEPTNTEPPTESVCTHKPNDDDGDCTTAVTCTSCCDVLTEAKNHDFSGQWRKDADGHWKVCQNEGCQVTDTVVEHTAGDDGACTVCDYAAFAVAENGFALLSAGKVDYFVGDAIDFSGLSLSVTFTNGKTNFISAEDVAIDTSAVDMNAEGEYPITVSFMDDCDLTFNIYVYTLESIKLDFDVIEEIEDATTGHTVYYNHSFRELYFVGDELDTTGLLVTVVAKCGEKTREFLVDDYTIDYFAFDSIDQYTITIGYADLEATIELWVTDAVPTPNEDGVYLGLIDPAYLGAAGCLSGPYHVFATIQEALDFFATIDPAAQKEIYIAPGFFNEKIEITVPNLKLIGWGDTPADVVIQWDNYCGQTAADGFVHVLDSTATVAVRESANNVTFENLTVANTHNNQGNASEAGLALLVQADGFTTADVEILGEQKTK